VKISDATASATIYYTTNGTTPTASSAKYTGPVTVAASQKLEAIAVTSATVSSPVGTASYTIQTNVPAPAFSVAAGTYSTGQSVTISDAVAGATIYYTNNGTTPTTASTKYTGAVTIGSSQTLQAIAVASGYTNSAVAAAVYIIHGALPKPSFSIAAGTYSTPQTVSITDTTAGATIYYTTNGTTPNTASTKYTGAMTIGSSQTLQAIAVASGYTNSAVTAAVYVINGALPKPNFSIAAGTYSTGQSVTISDTVAGATIYYTNNGTTPTTASTKYTGAVNIGSSQTLQAIAVASGYTNSAVTAAVYIISAAALPKPSFSIAAGTYSTGQSVSITDTTAATIYYTNNGTMPTTASTKYTGAVNIGSSQTLQAIAVASGYANSSVTAAVYVIK
jgi:hypothetical protein